LALTGINVYDLLLRETIVMTPEVVGLLEERFGQEPLPPMLFDSLAVDGEEADNTLLGQVAVPLSASM